MKKNYRWCIFVLGLILLVWVAGGVEAAPAFAAGFLQEGGGREVASSDWSARIPLALAATAVAILVDAIFIFWLLRSRKQQQSGK